MTEHSRSPAFVILDSHSPYAPHKSQICLRDWFPASVGHDLGTATANDTTIVDVEDSVSDLVAALEPFYLGTTQFDLSTVFTQAAAEGPAFPQASTPRTEIGTSIATGQAKAVAVSIQYRTTAFHIAKLVLLDAPVGAGGFEKIMFGDWTTPLLDLLGVLAAPISPFVGQDGNAFNQGVSITFTMNEKLRKLYRMT